MKVKLIEDILTEKVWVQIAPVDDSSPVPQQIGDPVWYLTTNRNQRADINKLTNQLKTGKVTGYKQTFFQNTLNKVTNYVNDPRFREFVIVNSAGDTLPNNASDILTNMDRALRRSATAAAELNAGHLLQSGEKLYTHHRNNSELRNNPDDVTYFVYRSNDPQSLALAECGHRIAHAFGSINNAVGTHVVKVIEESPKGSGIMKHVNTITITIT